MKQSLKTRLCALLLSICLLPECSTAQSVTLHPAELTVAHFLGEHVRLYTENGGVEEQLIAMSLAGQSLPPGAELSTLWLTEAGSTVGTAKELEQLTPAESKTYCLQISVSVSGQTVAQTDALYHVAVKSGSITVKIHAEKKVIKESDRLHFLAVKSTGEVFSCTAALERDPESGVAFLAGQFTGLPYGRYTVTPVAEEAALYQEAQCTCTLGLCAENDTVSTHRAFAQAVFALL